MKASTAIITALLSSAITSVYAQGVNDAQIASIVVTANQVDIDAGKLALRDIDERRCQEICTADDRRSHQRQ